MLLCYYYVKFLFIILYYVMSPRLDHHFASSLENEFSVYEVD